jgi:hypothetical protein
VDTSVLDLDEVANRCAQESQRFFRGLLNDPRFCFELFRRAFVQRDPLAWEHLYHTYRPLVCRWINSHPAFEDSGEELDYFANRVFDKIWGSITPQKFANFKELSALLGYLANRESLRWAQDDAHSRKLIEELERRMRAITEQLYLRHDRPCSLTHPLPSPLDPRTRPLPSWRVRLFYLLRNKGSPSSMPPEMIPSMTSAPLVGRVFWMRGSSTSSRKLPS